jgi:hypothetical protein
VVAHGLPNFALGAEALAFAREVGLDLGNPVGCAGNNTGIGIEIIRLISTPIATSSASRRNNRSAVSACD